MTQARKGLWTSADGTWASGHLIASVDAGTVVTRCGRTAPKAEVDEDTLTEGVSPHGKSCEACLRLSARDS